VLFVTRDHSLVNDLIKIGEMTPEEARTAPEKNVLTRAMQPHQNVRSKASCRLLEDIREGDYFFLCSDGMLEQMEEDQLVQIVSAPCADPEKVARLRKAAHDSKDNHSAHLIRVEAVLK
jgi:protein phosphatase